MAAWFTVVAPLLPELIRAARPMGLALLGSALVDAETRRLPDVLTALAALVGAILAWTRSPFDLALGAVVAVVAFGLLQAVRLAFRTRRGHEE